jgi:hypothetical protein
MDLFDLRLQANRDKLIHTTGEVIRAFIIGFIVGMIVAWAI